MLATFLLLQGCGTENQDSDVLPFPGLPDFEQEAARLNELGAVSVKTILGEDGSSETKTVTPDWEKEFRPFLSVNVNQARFRDAFEIEDSVNGNHRTLTLQAKNKAQEVQFLEATFEYGELSVIEILRNRESIVSNSAQKLTYAPGRFYSIEVLQEIDYVMGYTQTVKGEIQVPAK